MKKKYLIILICCIVLPLTVKATTFDKNSIISDQELVDQKSLSKNSIQSFLESQGGILASYTTKDGTAAQIIYNACQNYSLSPKFMLVTLQKESSLVTSKNASEKLLNKAFGFGCPDGGACSSKYSGFAQQVYAAAAQIRNGYLKDLNKQNYTVSGWGVNITKSALDGTVTPTNKATAVLYTYTPWIGYHGGESSVGGNSLFWDIWKRWFGFASEDMKYPNGTLLQNNENGIIYLIKNDQKNAFTSLGSLMANYDLNKVITVKKTVLDAYDEGVNILFPNYTLLQAPNGAMFLYVDGKKRGITSYEIFRNLGYNPEEAIPANWDEINNIPDGAFVTEKEIYPGGVLMQDKNTGAVVFVGEKGKRHEVFAKEILESNFQGMPMFAKNTNEIEEYKKGSPAKFRSGELVTSPKSNAVYLIEDGKKRAFESKKVFDKLGYQMKNVVYTSDNILKLHGKGKYITLNNKKVNSNKNKKKKKKKTSKKKTKKTKK